MKKLDFYVEQHEGFALGNFIACTPTIRALYEENGNTPIPVLFKTHYVKMCYIQSPYIEIIDKPRGVRLFGTDLICRQNNMTDYEFIYLTIIGKELNHDPFIDIPTDAGFIEYKKPFAVFVNGAGSEVIEYVNKKSIPLEFQKYLDSNIKMNLIATGSLNDEKRTFINQGDFGNIRRSLWLIANAEVVITNATGFYHAAGAMKKNQYVLWKDCRRPRSLNINENQTIITKENWKSGIENLIKFINNGQFV